MVECHYMISPCYFLRLESEPTGIFKKLWKPGSSESRFMAKNDRLLTQHAEKKGWPVLSGISIVNFLKKVHKTPVSKPSNSAKSKMNNCVLYGKIFDASVEPLVSTFVKAGFSLWLAVDAADFVNEQERESILVGLRKDGVQMWNTEFIVQNT